MDPARYQYSVNPVQQAQMQAQMQAQTAYATWNSGQTVRVDDFGSGGYTYMQNPYKETCSKCKEELTKQQELFEEPAMVCHCGATRKPCS
jgi:hypothetical protein